MEEYMQSTSTPDDDKVAGHQSFLNLQLQCDLSGNWKHNFLLGWN